MNEGPALNINIDIDLTYLYKAMTQYILLKKVRKETYGCINGHQIFRVINAIEKNLTEMDRVNINDK